MSANTSLTLWKPKVDVRVVAFQWVGQPVDMLPPWIISGANMHIAGRYLHLFVRNHTMIAAPQDWIMLAPDVKPLVVPAEVFPLFYTAAVESV